MQIAPQASIDLPGIKKLRSGKVREVFDLGETLLFVATDRLSAFDVILPDPIPKKGAVLNQLSAFWFKRFDKIDIGAGGSRATKTGKPERVNEPGGELINHFVTANFDEFTKNLQAFRAQLAGRSMIVRKAKPLPVECVVRLSCRLRLERISGIAECLRPKIARRFAACVAIAGADFHAGDKERHRTRSQHRYERVPPNSGK